MSSLKYMCAKKVVDSDYEDDANVTDPAILDTLCEELCLPYKELFSHYLEEDIHTPSLYHVKKLYSLRTYDLGKSALLLGDMWMLERLLESYSVYMFVGLITVKKCNIELVLLLEEFGYKPSVSNLLDLVRQGNDEVALYILDGIPIDDIDEDFMYYLTEIGVSSDVFVAVVKRFKDVLPILDIEEWPSDISLSQYYQLIDYGCPVPEDFTPSVIHTDIFLFYVEEMGHVVTMDDLVGMLYDNHELVTIVLPTLTEDDVLRMKDAANTFTILRAAIWSKNVDIFLKIYSMFGSEGECKGGFSNYSLTTCAVGDSEMFKTVVGLGYVISKQTVEAAIDRASRVQHYDVVKWMVATYPDLEYDLPLKDSCTDILIDDEVLLGLFR